MIRSAFLGTPASALPALAALLEVSDVIQVLTRPDQARGRSKTPRPSPVRVEAEERGVPVATPHDRADLMGVISALDLDVAVVAAFGMIIPAATLALPTAGMVNVHFSLLPRWRGAAPVERTMLAGDAITGVTLMQMDAGLDTGPLLATWSTTIGADETAGGLTSRLAVGGAELLVARLGSIVAGDIAAIRQAEEQASYAPMLTTAEARLDWSMPAHDIACRIRAFNPRPGAHTSWRGERFKIHMARVVPAELAPGSISLVDGRPVVGCGELAVELVAVQPAGSKQMPADAWARGVHGQPGRFE